MRISKELQDIRNALRPTTQRKATALMNEVEIERQKAAAKGDYPLSQWLRTQIESLGQASIAADSEAVDNFEIAWNKRKAEQKAEADKVLKAIEPPSDPIARLNAARKLQARKDKV